MVKLINLLTTLLLSAAPLRPTAASGIDDVSRFMITTWAFHNPDCFGKHIPFAEDHKHYGARKRIGIVEQEQCTSWPKGPPFIAMKYNWLREVPEDDAPERYGKCNLTLFSDLDCKGDIVHVEAKINDPETLWFHKCSGGFSAPAKSATILCNPRKKGMYELETWSATGPAVPKRTQT